MWKASGVIGEGLDSFPIVEEIEAKKRGIHCAVDSKLLKLTLFNRLLMGERMPEEWRRSVLIPIYKNKGDAQCCGNYRGIKLISHTMKVWERIIETRLRDRVEISKQ